MKNILFRSLMRVSLLVALLAARGAGAQDAPAGFGRAHQVVVSSERLFGYVHGSSTRTSAGMDTTSTSNNITFFSNPFAGLTSTYAIPRVAFDGFAIDGLSLGASASFFSSSLPSAIGGNTTTITGFMLTPRVGYAARLARVVALWPRVGVTYLSLTSSSSAAMSTSTTSSRFALTIEAPFALVIAEHLAATVGPTVDLGLGGSQSAGAMSIDQKATDIGVQCGLLGYF
jgi:hypothetical protein